MKCLKLTKKVPSSNRNIVLTLNTCWTSWYDICFCLANPRRWPWRATPLYQLLFHKAVIFFGTLPYNLIHLQNKYLFDASPGSAKITCENIAHTIYIRKYTLVPTLGFLKVYLSFEEKKKKEKKSSQVSKECQSWKLLLDASSFTKVPQ